MEPPDAAEAMGIGPPRPFLLKGAQRFRQRQPRPIIGHVQEAAAAVTAEADLVDGVGGAATGRNTALKARGCVGNGFSRLALRTGPIPGRGPTRWQGSNPLLGRSLERIT